jgi:hypothetical protein
MSNDNQFAKLYEQDGRQLLVTKGNDSEGEPALVFRTTTKVSGHHLQFAISFQGRSENSRYNRMCKEFDKMTEDSAWGLCNSVPGNAM